MIRFGNGLHSVDHHILVQAQLDSQDAAIWLQDTIRNLYGHEATLTPVSRQTPTGVVQRFIVRVPKGSAALVLQTGLYSRYTKNMVLGLPGDIINGKSDYPQSRKVTIRQDRPDQGRLAWRVPRRRTPVRPGQGQLSRNRMSES